jgi:hypothetical protein
MWQTFFNFLKKIGIKFPPEKEYASEIFKFFFAFMSNSAQEKKAD